MRATLFYTMLAMTILNAVDSASEVPAELKAPAASPSITVVKLDTTRLVTYVNQSELIESDASIRRVSVGNPELIEVVAVSNRELVVNAKAVGETTLLVWSAAGRKPFTVVVLPLPGKVDLRLKFLPTVTPRGTIHLNVAPEVSALDYSNSLQVSGYTIPGLSVRKMQTDIELEDGQSFVIGGLIDNQITETIDKIPGLSKIPLLGKLFQSRSVQKNNSELLVLVTPEIVRPIQPGESKPEVPMPSEFLKSAATSVLTNPVASETVPPRTSIPVEELTVPEAPKHDR